MLYDYGNVIKKDLKEEKITRERINIESMNNENTILP